MHTNPCVTFVMPAYNAAPYIDRAIGSVLAQTRGDWRLIIVNDGSTDATADIARGYARSDARISVFDMPLPSGCAYQPRRRAIEMAGTELVAPLDADDWVAPDYLERLLARLADSQAEAVFPTMYSVKAGEKPGEKPGEPERFLPCAGFPLYAEALPGRDCVAFTLDGWRMGFNGGLIPRRALLRAQRALGESAGDVYSDELLTRNLMLDLGRVAVSEAK